MDQQERRKLLGGVKARVAGFLSPEKKPFKAVHFRFIMMGLVIGCTMNEVLSYMLIRKSIELGEVPPVFIDLVFGCISFVTVLTAPALCWAGGRRRITCMSVWLLVGVLPVFPLFFMPFQGRETSELCNTVFVSTSPVSALSVARLTVVVSLALINALAVVSLWAHGVAIADAHSPGTVCMDLAVIIGFRVFLMTAGFEIMYEFVESRLWLQLLGLVPHPVVAVLLMRRSYGDEVGRPGEAQEKRGPGFFSSLTSVLSNRWAMFHALTAALLVAGLWGFASNDYDAAKAKYHVTWSYNNSNNFAVVIRGFLIVLFVKINGYEYSSPIAKTFDKSSASMNTVRQTARALIGLVIIATTACSKTAIDGIANGGYSIPSCSLGCGCTAPASQFNPVCMVDTMTTYFSPCHAGCTGTLEVNNVTLYSSCRCALAGAGAGAGRAAPGACARADCDAKYAAHQMISSIVIAFILIAIMMQMMLVLRSVRAREKAMALGVIFSFSSLIAYVGGHLGYKTIAMHTCLFWDGGKCQLQKEVFGTVVYFTSVGLFAVVIIVNLVMAWVYKKKQKAAEAEEKAEIELAN